MLETKEMTETTTKKSLGSLKAKHAVEIVETMSQLIDDPSYLQSNFVMLHGTNCAWDRSTQSMIKCEHMKLSFPISFPIWKSNPSREIIPISDLVFAPKGEKQGQINMFKGLNAATYGDGYKFWKLHLLKLCGGDTKQAHWLTCWIAYQLKNVGSKMRTSIVMFGDEGTGKNILFDTVQAIFGSYGIQIGQSQIESQFNAWASCKLFIIANEVISRRERKHIKGKLKALVTEQTININQKSMPERVESNFANFVFLSNEDVPIDADEGDRRYMMINALKSPDMDKEYFHELIENIVPSDVHGYLLNYDCTIDGVAFNEYTQPMMTNAKNDVISANLTSQQKFIKAWLAGETDFPVQSIPSVTLYWAYRCWCAINGEKFPCVETAFGLAMKKEGVLKERVCLLGLRTKATAYFIDEKPHSPINPENFRAFETTVTNLREKYKVQ